MLKAMTNFVVDTKFITTLSDCVMSVTVSLRMQMIPMYVAFGLGLVTLHCLWIPYHSIPNAFTLLCFGANIYGINGCCPGENLHMVQKGLMSYALVAFTKMFWQKHLQCSSTSFARKFPPLCHARVITTTLRLPSHICCWCFPSYMPANIPVCFLSWSFLSTHMHAGHLICLMTILWGTPQTLMQNPLRSFVIYLRYYFALRPGTSWMQFQRKTLTVVGLAVPLGLPLKKWWQLLIGRRVWVWSLPWSIVPLTLTTTLLCGGWPRSPISGPCESGHKEHIEKMPSKHNVKRINLTSRLLSIRWSQLCCHMQQPWWMLPLSLPF